VVCSSGGALVLFSPYWFLLAELVRRCPNDG